ncbi:MAG: (2Fe-2S)-binding protein [Clostridia bacterium]|nr:(2Fe-2S)-binding protein [Clostridia bacterium]
MEEKVDQKILDKITKVCICKAIPRSRIKEAIKSGAVTLLEVQQATGAGSGGCKGNRCTPKILDLLKEFNEA